MFSFFVQEEGEELRNTMVLDEDPFTTKLLTFQQEGLEFSPVIATRPLLQSLGPSEVCQIAQFIQELYV